LHTFLVDQKPGGALHRPRPRDPSVLRRSPSSPTTLRCSSVRSRPLVSTAPTCPSF